MITTSAMDLEIYQSRGDIFFLIRGRIVLEECERLKAACLPLITKGLDQVIVDLSNVEFIDSAGLGVLVGFKMAASKNKSQIVLLQPSKSVSDILYISKLDGIFDIMTGAEADMLKTQIAQPANRAGATSVSRGAQPATAPPVRPASVPPAAAPVESLSEVVPSNPPSAAPARPAASVETTLKSDKEMIEDHCRRAVEFMRQGNYDMSVTEYERALQIDPDYLPALNNLAIVYEKQPSWHGQAIDQWEHVLQLSQQRGDQKHIDRAQRHLANLRRMSAS
ncbi:MAG: anti-sigma factor antagonist [Candidatus Sumerlaeaceae bacterium]|nr:anti-sigma factor antagonist [Candidatus Sumerlaeaceae bacterium]